MVVRWCERDLNSRLWFEFDGKIVRGFGEVYETRLKQQ